MATAKSPWIRSWNGIQFRCFSLCSSLSDCMSIRGSAQLRQVGAGFSQRRHGFGPEWSCKIHDRPSSSDEGSSPSYSGLPLKITISSLISHLPLKYFLLGRTESKSLSPVSRLHLWPRVSLIRTSVTWILTVLCCASPIEYASQFYILEYELWRCYTFSLILLSQTVIFACSLRWIESHFLPRLGKSPC